MSGSSQERSLAGRLLELAVELETLGADRRTLRIALNGCLAAVRAAHDLGDSAAVDCDRLLNLNLDLRHLENRACLLILRITALVQDEFRG